MTGPTVRTLTLNPTIDFASETERVAPTVKLRTVNERMDAGAGGMDARDALRWGSAAGAATAATPRTGLCEWAEVEALIGQVREPQPL